MNKGKYIGTLLIVAILAAIFIFLVNRKTSYNWETNLRSESYEPYDIGIYKDLLEKSFDDRFKHITKSHEFELATDSGSGTFIYIDGQIKLSDDHIDKLLEFIERGNTVIFSCNIIPENLIERITTIDFNIEYSQEKQLQNHLLHSSFGLASQEEAIDDYYEYVEEEQDNYNLFLWDSIANVAFIDQPGSSFTFSYIQKDSLEEHLWSGIDRELFEDYNSENDFTPISLLNDSLIDVISMIHGKGKLYVHMNPILFSNIYFIEKSGFDYANRFSDFFADGNVYFNEHYHYAHRFASDNSSFNKEDIRSPLSFILSHKGLKWTLYGILIMSILYLLFAFKRRLPVIAFFHQPTNTSISYVKALSSFYYSAKDHTLLSSEMMLSFKHFLRKRYHINTNKDKEELIPLVAKYSGISEEKVSHIFELDFKINFSNESKSKGSIELYNTLEYFYANCK